jgi:hypothetical protein
MAEFKLQLYFTTTTTFLKCHLQLFLHQSKNKNYQNSKYMKQTMWKKRLETSNIYSSMQLELKYKQQINKNFLKKSQQSEMSFSLSSSNTSSTVMESLKNKLSTSLHNPHMHNWVKFWLS